MARWRCLQRWRVGLDYRPGQCLGGAYRRIAVLPTYLSELASALALDGRYGAARAASNCALAAGNMASAAGARAIH